MTLIVQQPYNMFRPGQVQGETPEQFAAGKQAANSQTGAVSQPVVEQKPAPVVQQPQVQKQQKQPALDGNSSTAGMDYLNSLYTSPEEEERLRKASVMNQRILAIGDAIRHIGNIANTVNYAPAQQFNSPVAEEQARYERGKALRDRANQQFYTYQQQKAAQDRAAAKMERDYQLKVADDKRKEALNDARISRMYAQSETDGARKVYWDTRARLLEEGWPLEKALKEARAAQAKAAANLSTVKANQGGFAPKSGSSGGSGGNKYWAYDQEGNIHYYPNKSMYEQGVYEFSQGQNRNEEYKKGTDAFGNPISGVRRTPVTSLGGERARQAKQKKANEKKANPMGGSSNGKKKNPMS